MIKERTTTPRYWQILIDMQVLKQKQEDYHKIFGTHSLWPEANYQKEINKVKNEWTKYGTPPGGGRSLEKDLQRLYEQYSQIQLDEYTFHGSIRQLFNQIYGYFLDIVSDVEKKYLSPKDYQHYLTLYSEVIIQNKEAGLEDWNDKPIAKIEKEIANQFLTHQVN